LAAFADSQPSFVVAHDSFALCEDGFPSEGQGASVVAPTITTAPSCNAPGVVTALPSDAYTWNVSTDGTTYTAVPKTVNGHDYILSGQTEFAFDIAQLTGDQCSVAPTSVTPTATARLGSCTEAGHVDLGVSPGYSWGPNTGTTNDPTYTATANEGYVLTGTPGFTFHGISKFDPQSTACFVPPPATTITTLTPGPATVAPVVTSPGEVEGIVQEAPTVTTPAATTPAATAAAPTTLAFTGAEPVPLSLCGLLALVLGAVLTVASRRPRAMRQRARLARK